MTQAVVSSPWLVVGLGATGWSVAQYLSGRGQAFVLTDTRAEPADLARFLQAFPQAVWHPGPLNAEALLEYETWVVSPGVSLQEPVVQQAQAAGCRLLGDIALFSEAAQRPLIAITGSNGKSTVTSLIGHLLQAAGQQVLVGGNIGVPALDLLTAPLPDFYVLEVSSFQLDTTPHLQAEVAVFLNLSPDHLDRHVTLTAYQAAKQRVYLGCRAAVYNQDDPATWPTQTPARQHSFSLVDAQVSQDGAPWLAFDGVPLMPTRALSLSGATGRANVLAALSVMKQLGFEARSLVTALSEFTPLPHRCVRVGCHSGVDYINDSKATNIGAALAGIQGLSGDYAQLWLILGGQGKGQNFADLAAGLPANVAGVALIGEAAQPIAQTLPADCDAWLSETLAQAVEQLAQKAKPGDAVVLSPACASFDQFSGFAQRGEVFAACVERLS